MNDFKVITGFFAGAVIGIAIGTLIAPEEGKKLRKKILDEAEKLAGNLLEEGDTDSRKGISQPKQADKQN